MELLKETINKTYQNLYNNEKKKVEDIINDPQAEELFKLMKQHIYAEHKINGYKLRPLNIDAVSSVSSVDPTSSSGSVGSDGSDASDEMTPTNSEVSVVSSESEGPPLPSRTDVDDGTECSVVGAKEGDPCGGDSGKKCVSPIGDGKNLICATEIEEAAEQHQEMRAQKEEQRVIGQKAAEEAAQQASEKIQSEQEARTAEEQRNAEEAAKTSDQKLSEEVSGELESDSDSDEDTPSPTTATSGIPPPPSSELPAPPPVPSPPSSLPSMGSEDEMTEEMRQGVKEAEDARLERERAEQQRLEAEEAAKKKQEEDKEREKQKRLDAEKQAELQLEAEYQAEIQEEEKEKRLEKEYLNGIKIQHAGAVKDLNSVEAISRKLLNPDLINFGVANEFIRDIEWKLAGKAVEKGKERTWIDCGKYEKCYDTLTKYLNMEFKLTAFMLRILSKSVIDISNKNPLVFHITDISKLNGQWENDKKYIDIVEVEKGKKKRLIMGFGPSASGKTFWTENVIRMMDESDPNFPKVFISIDGGLIREYSEIYQDIVRNTPSIIKGFKNLTQGKKMAPTNGAKKAMKNYLMEQKEKNSGDSVISVYVPETLAKCYGRPSSFCAKEYNSYIKLTGDDDSWIGLLIWQTKEKCERSGKAREVGEGKKYTSKWHGTSMKHGTSQMKRGMGGRIDINNSGTPTEKSTIKEYPVNGKYLLKADIVSKYNSNYIREGETDSDTQTDNDDSSSAVSSSSIEEKSSFSDDELISLQPTRNVVAGPRTPRRPPPKRKAPPRKTRKTRKKPVAPPRKQSLKKSPPTRQSGGRRSILTRKRGGNRSNRNITRRVRFRKLG